MSGILMLLINNKWSIIYEKQFEFDNRCNKLGASGILYYGKLQST